MFSGGTICPAPPFIGAPPLNPRCVILLPAEPLLIYTRLHPRSPGGGCPRNSSMEAPSSTPRFPRSPPAEPFLFHTLLRPRSPGAVCPRTPLMRAPPLNPGRVENPAPGFLAGGSGDAIFRGNVNPPAGIPAHTRCSPYAAPAAPAGFSAGRGDSHSTAGQAGFAPWTPTSFFSREKNEAKKSGVLCRR